VFWLEQLRSVFGPCALLLPLHWLLLFCVSRCSANTETRTPTRAMTTKRRTPQRATLTRAIQKTIGRMGGPSRSGIPQQGFDGFVTEGPLLFLTRVRILCIFRFRSIRKFSHGGNVSVGHAPIDDLCRGASHPPPPPAGACSSRSTVAASERTSACLRLGRERDGNEGFGKCTVKKKIRRRFR